MKLTPIGQPLDSLHHYRGAGFPEGRVSAPVGSIYTDLDATAGAIRWIKTSGTGNTGWVVEYGDTGWRNINSLLPAGSTGNLRFQRVNNKVTFLFSNVTLPAGVIYFRMEVPNTIPVGTHHHWIGEHYTNTTSHTTGTGRHVFYVTGTNHFLFTSASRSVSGSASWETTSPWSTSRPGTPA